MIQRVQFLGSHSPLERFNYPVDFSPGQNEAYADQHAGYSQDLHQSYPVDIQQPAQQEVYATKYSKQGYEVQASQPVYEAQSPQPILPAGTMTDTSEHYEEQQAPAASDSKNARKAELEESIR